MKKAFTYILLLVLMCPVSVSCSRDEHRVIPRSKMTKVISDMLLADQWLIVVGDEGNRSDNTLFYEAVFNKYGYTTADYLKSIDYYLKDPGRFSKIVKKASARMSARKKEIEGKNPVPDEKENKKSIEPSEK